MHKEVVTLYLSITKEMDETLEQKRQQLQLPKKQDVIRKILAENL